jgi:hypothetical protein
VAGAWRRQSGKSETSIPLESQYRGTGKRLLRMQKRQTEITSARRHQEAIFV